MFRIGIVVMAGAALLMGCDSGPKRTGVTGVVTIDGKPLAKKNVKFKPLEDTAGRGGIAVTDEAGNYSATAFVPGATKMYKGLPPGRYRVTVLELAPILSFDDASADEDITMPGAVSAVRPRRSEIPAIYRSPQSPLVVEVPESGGTFDIELKSKPGR